jgi:hypothetical protein
LSFSPIGVCSARLRHARDDEETLKALEVKAAQEGLVLTDLDAGRGAVPESRWLTVDIGLPPSDRRRQRRGVQRQGFLDGVDKLRRRLPTSIPSKSNVMREAVMEALKRGRGEGRKVMSPHDRSVST